MGIIILKNKITSMKAYIKSYMPGNKQYKNTSWNPEIKDDEWVIVDKDVPRARLATLTPAGGRNPNPEGPDSIPQTEKTEMISNNNTMMGQREEKRETIELASAGVCFRDPSQGLMPN